MGQTSCVANERRVSIPAHIASRSSVEIALVGPPKLAIWEALGRDTVCQSASRSSVEIALVPPPTQQIPYWRGGARLRRVR